MVLITALAGGTKPKSVPIIVGRPIPTFALPLKIPLVWIKEQIPEASRAAEISTEVSATFVPAIAAILSGTAIIPLKAVKIFWNPSREDFKKLGLSSTSYSSFITLYSFTINSFFNIIITKWF